MHAAEGASYHREGVTVPALPGSSESSDCIAISRTAPQ
jgi:hypothetical protein